MLQAKMPELSEARTLLSDDVVRKFILGCHILHYHRYCFSRQHPSLGSLTDVLKVC